MHWRLGIDLGTNSLGWAAIELAGTDPDSWRPVGILASGSRIFSDGRDPKSKQSLAVDRREARAMRRRRDRFQQRQRALMKYLVADGLFPSDPAERKALATLDPFELRARALDEALPLSHLGRAIWHLNQRRGFKSNRKTDKPDKPGDDGGKIKAGVGQLQDAIDNSGARTFGEWLFWRRRDAGDCPSDNSVRARLDTGKTDETKGAGYEFYPGRSQLEHEFYEIWNAQAPYHPDILTPEVRDRLFEIVFYQRPLKTPEVGTCTLVPGERRLPKAHPLFQRRRLLEEVNALKIVRAGQVAERLTPEQRDLLLLKLKDKARVSFETLRKVLKLEPDARFNKESENRKELKGNEVNAATATKSRFGGRWAHLSIEKQAVIIDRLEAIESDDELADFQRWIVETYDLTPDQADAVTSVRLPAGHGRFGITATTGLIEMLTNGRTDDGHVLVYSEAVERLGWHHSDHRSGAGHALLPYYGAVLERHLMPGTGNASDPEDRRIGRLTNPTVHIGLNQLQRTINRLIEKFGKPAQIAVELARDLKLSEDEKKDLNARNKRNREEAERRSAALRDIGIDDTGANRARLKLWEELDGTNILGRVCPYSGERISIRRLFSEEVEVDHILPFAATLDDSSGNMLVCMRHANRTKHRQSPWQAWGRTAEWDAIAERASRLPRNKRWRFEPDAMDRFQAEGGFLARQLVDTQYLSRLAREYLESLYPEKAEGSARVWVSPGRLTEMVRRKLDLNGLLGDHNLNGGATHAKNRLDHRHHAIDAIVIAIVDRRMLKAISDASAREGEEGRERIVIRPPWDGFHDAVKASLDAIVVSHRADHGTAGHGLKSTAGRLHNDTAYGITGQTDASGNMIVVRRKLFASIRPGDIPAVRDPDLRALLYEMTEGKEGDAFAKALEWIAREGPEQFRHVRRVRMTESLTVIPIRDAEGRAYKGYKGDSNYRYDVWELPDGKWVTQWRDRDGIARSSVVSMFDAHQPVELPRPHPAARRVLSLHQDDIIAVQADGQERRLMRVVKFGQNGQVTLAPPNEAGDLKRRDATSNDIDPFKYTSPTAGGLKKLRARKVGVDETGYVRDPGFPARTAVRRTRSKAA